jgi:hypothetical protein
VAVVNLNVGIVSLITPQRLYYGKSVTVGSYLILVGFVRFIIQVLEQSQNSTEHSRYYEDD